MYLEGSPSTHRRFTSSRVASNSLIGHADLQLAVDFGNGEVAPATNGST